MRLVFFPLVVCFAQGSYLVADEISNKPGAHEKILTIADNDWAPYFFAGKKEKPEGLGKELLKKCLPEGMPVQFIYYPVKRMFLEFEKGTLDLLVMSHMASREKFSVYPDEDHSKKTAFLNKTDQCLRDLKSNKSSFLKDIYRRYGSVEEGL